MKKTLRNSLFAALALTLAFGVVGRAQTPSLADSVWLTVVNDEAYPGVQDGNFAVEIWITNSATLTGGTLGFVWSDTANWRVDSGRYGPATMNWEIKPHPTEAVDTAQANSIGAALIGGAAIFSTTAPGSGQLWGTIYFSEKAGSTWGAGSTMTIDSSFVPPGGDFLFITSSGSVIPTFLPALKVTFNDVLGGDGSVLPSEFELAQNYPNPFNPSTKIEYGVPVRSAVKLEVFNILGQKVKTLIDDELDAGYGSVTWNGDNDAGARVSSGVYFYKFTAGDVVQTRKMMLMK